MESPSYLLMLINTIYNNIPWMSWNLFLALTPLFIAYLLFSSNRKKAVFAGIAALIAFIPRSFAAISALTKIIASLTTLHHIFLIVAIALVFYGCIASKYSRRIRQVVGLLLFYLFLPNAPYVLTDIIHMYDHIRQFDAEIYNTIVIVPMYAVFMLIGLTSYIISLVEFEHWIINIGLKKFIVAIEITTHLLCAVGIYLGRFLRLNSWDIATNPTDVFYSTFLETTSIGTMKIVFATFIIISFLYYIGKWLNSIITEHYKMKSNLHGQFLS